MAELKLSEDRTRGDGRSQRMIIGACALGLIWGVLCVGVLWDSGAEIGVFTWVLRLVGLLLPLGLIALAAMLGLQHRALQDELTAVRDDMEALRLRRERMSRLADPEQAAASATPKRPAIPEPALEFSSRRDSRAAPPTFSSRREHPVTPPQDPQASLPLGSADVLEASPLSVADLIRALHFPETAQDRDGFRALNRALKDHRAAQVIAAAQDMLTLLSQDGLYMDDLPPERSRPEMWRRFAKGERDASLGALGGIRDSDSIAVCAARLRDNTVFRDAAHHFLRRFDRMLADIEPQMSDEDIVQLTDTRSARAFMLVGRAAGIFDRG